MIIKDNIPYNTVNINTDVLEVQGVELHIKKNKYTIINFYRPPNKNINKAEDLINIIKPHLTNSTIICGDINAASPLWGHKNKNPQGKIVEEVVEGLDLVVLNTGEITRWDTHNSTGNPIDITLASPNIAPISDWSVSDQNLGSDHFVIEIEISGITTEKTTKARWKFDKANWRQYHDLCKEHINEHTKSENINTFNDKLTDTIIQIAEETIPKTKGGKSNKATPWWNDECNNAKKDRESAFRQQKKPNATLQDKIKYKQTKAKARFTINKSKTHIGRNSVQH